MRIQYLLFRTLFLYSVCTFLYNVQSSGQSISVTTNGPQTISVNSASLSSNASSNNSINSTKWTKFSVPGQTPKKVTVIGSSTAANNGVTNFNNAFVNKLRAYYQAEGIASDFVNLAVAGTTPFDIDINAALNNTAPDILMVCYPSNGYFASNNGNMINRYFEFQNACNSRGIQMIVTGTQPRDDFSPDDRANLITMNNLLRTNFPDRFIDFLTPLLNTNGNTMKTEYRADGIHPNDAGHEVLFQLVKAFNIFQFSASSASTINNPGSANTNITNLASGIHRFQVAVGDVAGFAASAYAVITVNGNGNGGPGANAGAPLTITLPGNVVTLNGSGTAGNGGTITFAWTQTGGPVQPLPVIALPTSPVTQVTGLVQGVYTFRLTVLQNDGQTATSDVTVTVNAGAAAKLIPGKIEAESWDAKNGPQYAVASTDAGGGLQVIGIANGSWLDYNVNVQTAGIYTVNFRIATTQANAQFQVKSGSTVLGTITIASTGSWGNWATVALNNVSLTAGVQALRILSVTNESANFNWMDFVLAGSPAPPPTANAGTAQSITLPVSQAALSGSGTVSNGGPIVYGWTQVGGTAATIASPSSASTNITGLTTEGVRTFRLTVTQSDNQTATNDVTVTVNPASGGGGGGNGKTIPGKIEAESWDAKSGGMYAIATNDAGGGQHVVGIANGSWMDYNVNVQTAGTYTVNFRVATTQANTKFQLKLGNTVLGTVTIPGTGNWNTWATVPLTNISLTTGAQTLRILSITNETCNLNWMDFVLTAGGNPPPTANAGTAQSITLPVSQAALSGSGTVSNGGPIVYGWTQVGGTAATIASPSSASTNITGLTTEGVRTFRLTVTQSDNQTATNDVTVTVNPASGGGGGPSGKVIPGKVEAESFDAKFGPLYATTTTDAGGGQQVIGINNGSWMDYNVNVMTSGTYMVNFRIATTQAGAQFQLKLGNTILGTITLPSTGDWNTWLTVPLNNIPLTAGAQTLRILSVTNATCNFNWMDFALTGGPPTANAGPTQTITSPASQVTLAGSGAANNIGGSVTSHVWSKFNGGTASITDVNNYGTTVTGLSVGTYTFRLTVTQSDNQTSTSDVTIIVNPASGPAGKTIPGKIEAESWDTKSGGMYAVATNDAGGGQHVVGISNGSWMDYNVTVTQPGIYTVNFRVATTQANTQFQVKLGAAVLGTITIPNTGGWGTWVTVALNNVSLAAGAQIVRIQSITNETCNFNWTDWVFAAPFAAHAVANATTQNISSDMAAPVQKEIKINNLSLSVFPNPASSCFNLEVQSKNREAVIIRITDIAGKQVQQLQTMPGQAIMFGDKMMNGTYLVEVRQGSERIVTKVVKQ